MDARRFEQNPFYVLGLPTTCTRADVERQGRKLLATLELGLSRDAAYDTPLGPRMRTPELVRAAMAQLRDPGQRRQHELWTMGEAMLEHAEAEAASDDDELPDPATACEGFPALQRLGWRRS